ncbi:uncharacterized protein EAF01_009042 [Botrytis porri]|uniref:uncharacterized protein n=1 Tax=Botrytis porri TaxID=87229 RepID=UPI001901174E|nr:uncharacterized protein EAF01_009042 [Botrytis porri]KAF7896639.1 hypothetical protein EAF01_009042 [Botrytis porri]
MSSSKEELTKARIATLAEHDNVKNYETRCTNVKNNEKLPQVVRDWKAFDTYNVTKDNKEVKNFIRVRGTKGSDKDIKKLRDIEVVKKPFKWCNTTWLERAWKLIKRQIRPKKSIPQPSGSSTRSTQNPSNAGNGNSTQNRPRVREDVNKPDFFAEDLQRLRNPQNFFGDQLPPAVDKPNNTPRDGSRGRSRDMSNSQTGSEPPASTPKKVEPKINSGKHRVPSRHT